MSTVQITVRGISSTPVINYHVERQFNRLEKAYSKINTCKVVIDLAKNNTHKGKLYSVCIDITISGKELVSKKQNTNLFIAIRDSFSALEQLLKKHHKKKLFVNKNVFDYLYDSNHDIQSSA